MKIKVFPYLNIRNEENWNAMTIGFKDDRKQRWQELFAVAESEQEAVDRLKAEYDRVTAAEQKRKDLKTRERVIDVDW